MCSEGLGSLTPTQEPLTHVYYSDCTNHTQHNWFPVWEKKMLVNWETQFQKSWRIFIPINWINGKDSKKYFLLSKALLFWLHLAIFFVGSWQKSCQGKKALYLHFHFCEMQMKFKGTSRLIVNSWDTQCTFSYITTALFKNRVLLYSLTTKLYTREIEYNETANKKNEVSRGNRRIYFKGMNEFSLQQLEQPPC